MIRTTIRLYATNELTKKNIRKVTKLSLDSDEENMESIRNAVDDAYEDREEYDSIMEAIEYASVEEVMRYITVHPETIVFMETIDGTDEYDMDIEFNDEKYLKFVA